MTIKVRFAKRLLHIFTKITIY